MPEKYRKVAASKHPTTVPPAVRQRRQGGEAVEWGDGWLQSRGKWLGYQVPYIIPAKESYIQINIA
jgi:hypothetical protein